MEFSGIVYDRAQRAAFLRKNGKILLVLGLMILGEMLLIGYEVRQHRDLVLHTGFWIALFLFPLTIVAVVARSPLGTQRTMQRLVIRPFGTMMSKPEHDGAAIASLLHRDLAAWAPKLAKASLEGKVGDSPMAKATLSLGGASVPLEWLWSRMYKLITGKEAIVVEGLLIDTDTPFELQAWRGDKAETFGALIEKEPFSVGLLAAVEKLGRALMESLEPARMAEIYSGQWKDEESIRLIKMEPESPQQRLQAIKIYLDGEHVAEAARLLMGKETPREGSREYFEYGRLDANLKIKQGDFAGARAILDKMCGHAGCEPVKACDLRCLVADTYTYEGRYGPAIAEYDEAMRLSMKAAESLALDKGLRLKRALEMADWTLYDDPNKATDALWTAVTIAKNRSRCRDLLAQGATDETSMRDEDGVLVEEDLQFARDAVESCRSLPAYIPHLLDLEAAVITSAKAHYRSRRGDRDAFWRAADEAIELYERTIGWMEQRLQPADDDMSTRANMAWSYYGIAANKNLQLELMRREWEEKGLKKLEFGWDYFAELPEESQSAACGHLRRAVDLFREQDKARYAERLGRACQGLTEAAVKHFGQETTQLLHEMEQVEIEGAGETDFEETETVKQDIAALASEYEAKFDLDGGDVARLYRGIWFRLDAVCRYERPEEINGWVAEARLAAEVYRIAKRCKQAFEEIQIGQRRPDVEGLYGMACLCAMGNDGAGAARALREAGKKVGERMFTYRNRAILDKDFDSIRRTAEFDQLVWDPGQHGRSAAVGDAGTRLMGVGEEAGTVNGLS